MAHRIETRLEGLVLVEPNVFGDDRGFLVETYRADLWRELGIDLEFVQHNHSRSVEGTLRGLHFQAAPGQAKLVRCSAGRIFDVAVDLRRGSPTFGQWEGPELDDRAHRQLLIPIGFGHGFCVLSEHADVDYQLSSLYDPATESGIAWDDPEIGIDWPVSEPLLSERDKAAPRLSQVADSLPFEFGAATATDA
jgi:dTDP-4-dehydrorhamnose 3,5-epimerase